MLLPTTWSLCISAPSMGFCFAHNDVAVESMSHFLWHLAEESREDIENWKCVEVAKWIHQLHPLLRMNEVTSHLNAQTSEPNTARSMKAGLWKQWIWPAHITSWYFLWLCRSQQTGKFLKIWEYQTTLLVFWETCMWVKKQQLEPYVGQVTGSKLGKEYDKTVYCHPAYLTYMQSTSFKMLIWMNH